NYRGRLINRVSFGIHYRLIFGKSIYKFALLLEHLSKTRDKKAAKRFFKKAKYQANELIALCVWFSQEIASNKSLYKANLFRYVL
ncbi:hypothetical protein P4630_27515, partial [Peribacillus simplex]|uniref:hypothetical protein n=1 Tax=Peribacillus simplex TaxID=1478 RepID=UPI002E1F23E9|nr:hypothetical protein [Peribacillus simplex]